MNNYYIPKRYRIYRYVSECDPILGDDGMYHFLYKIINTTNRKYYIGIHSTTDLLDGYSGSGKALSYSIRKYGPDVFEKNILRYCRTRNELIGVEAEYVTMNEVNDPNCYNLVLGGNPCAVLDGRGKKQKGMIYVYNYQICKRTRIYPEQLGEYLSNGWIKGYGPVSDAVKNCGFGKKLIHNDEGEIRWVSQDNLSYFLSNGWECGGLSGVNKDKIYIHKNRPDRSWPDRKLIYEKDLNVWTNSGWERGYGDSSDILKCGTITGKIYVTKNHKTKTIFPSELNKYLNSGWEKGVVGFEHHRALCGRKRMYDPKTNESLIVSPENQQEYLDRGWLYGMGKRKKNKYRQCFICKDRKYIKINIDLLDQYVKDGWVQSHPAKGSIQIHKDGKNKMIFRADLDKYLEDGWELGMKPKNNEKS